VSYTAFILIVSLFYRPPSQSSHCRYHEVADTNGIDDAILNQHRQAYAHTRPAHDSFKSYRDLDGGCLVQVLLLLLMLLISLESCV
jgi:hypothetical protein